MDGIKLPIFLVTFYLFFYTITPHIGIPPQVTATMYLFSPLLVIWMVYSVLKNGTPSTKTFDDQFYDDWPRY